MNVLGLVFSLMLILSYGFYACWDKQVASTKVRKTYLGHQKANRKILNSYQSLVYKNYRSTTKPSVGEETFSISKLKKEEQPTNYTQINQSCAKINLLPLIQEGKENNQALYDFTIHLIGSLYKPFCQGEKRFEHRLLDSLLKAAAYQKEDFSLEKIDLQDPTLQKKYYKMLKGTKNWDLTSKTGYPSLLDYIKIETSTDKICIFHAHISLLNTLFGDKAATFLYDELHSKETTALTKELIDTACSHTHRISPDPDLLDLLDLGPHHDHAELKKTLVAEDKASHVILKKVVHFPKG